MSYIVKGAELPDNCDQCRFQSDLRIYCDAMPYNFCGETDDRKRPDWCPLIALPEKHGRLIDADEMIRIWDGATFKGSIKPIIDARPTVIEAEGREE